MTACSLVSSLEKSKDSIYNTSLNTLLINKQDVYTEYPQIGYGCEGSIHKYNDLIALKIFMFINKESLPNKFKKIEELAKFQDSSFCFPKGLVGYEDEQKEGYFTDLVVTDQGLKDFEDLTYLYDEQRLIEYLLKAESAIERIHKKGFIIGDVKTDNIMIDINDNPRFVDVDNYAFGDYDFDIFPDRREWFKRVFGKDCSPIDSDRYLYAMVCLQYFAYGTLLHSATPRYFKTLIELMDIDSEAKDILRVIFSDAQDKPYIGPVLQKIHPGQKLLQPNDIQILNRIY